MKILMVLSQLEVTGAEVYAVNIGNKLVEEGNEIIYVSDTLTKKVNGKYISIPFNKRSLFYRIKNIVDVIKIVKKEKIDVIHAHSRASAWVAHYVSKFTNIPMVHTVHGKQPVHRSSKRFFPGGDSIIVVCENIIKNLVDELGVEKSKIKILANGVDTKLYEIPKNDFINEDKIVSIIGRLSGPKGEVAYNLMKETFEYDKYKVQMIGGKDIPSKFLELETLVNFMGYREDVVDLMAKSDLVIGAGRVAIEALLMGKNVIAIGEGTGIGLITKENVEEGIKSNFGDISYEGFYDWKWLKKEIIRGINLEKNNLRDTVEKCYSLDKITLEIMKEYERLIAIRRGK